MSKIINFRLRHSIEHIVENIIREPPILVAFISHQLVSLVATITSILNNQGLSAEIMTLSETQDRQAFPSCKKPCYSRFYYITTSRTQSAQVLPFLPRAVALGINCTSTETSKLRKRVSLKKDIKEGNY